jgi:hypothetical protein
MRERAVLFVLTFVAYAYFYGGGGWNQNANFDLTRAIVERHTFAIDAYYQNTGDISTHAGHIYANKAPGLSLLAAIPYALGLRSMVLCTVAICATSGALLIVLIFSYAVRSGASAPSPGAGGGGVPSALLLALLFAFGTYIFAYSTVFFAHVPTALCLFLAFVKRDNPWLAGAAAGLAVLCNYAALPAAIVIAVLIAVERRRAIVKVIAGGLPFAIFLIAYQTICFGGPFRTAVEATTENFKTRGAFLGVFTLPRLDVAFMLLFSRYRGLFFLSPFLIFAFAGAVVMIRKRDAFRVRELVTAAAVFLSFLMVSASFNGWHGGSAIGPRYMLPALPFLVVPMMAVVDRMRPLWIILGAISIAFNFAVVAVNPLPSRTIADPIFRYTLPLLIEGKLPSDTPPFPPYAWKLSLGHVSVNRQTDDELATFEKHPLGSPEAEWASFNLGEFIAPGSPWSLMPIVIWIAGGSLLLVIDARRRRLSPAR